MSYSTPAEFKARYDLRFIGDLVGDAGTQVSGTALNSDTVLQQLLDDAAGEILSALMVGKRYSAEDLDNLTVASANHLKRMECDIALRLLYDRRVYSRPSENLDKIYERAEKHLDKLQAGLQVFAVLPVPAQVDAQLPVVSGPTTIQLQSLNLVRGRTRNYFPTTPNPNDR